jgi:rhamnose transport system permease protein
METETTVETNPPTTVSSSRSLGQIVLRVAQVRELGLGLVLVLIVAFVGIPQPRFLDLNNLEHILQSVSIIAIVAVGETLVILTRNVDLSVGSIVGLCAFASADLLKNHNDLNLILVFLFGCAIGAVLGAVNGVLVAYAGIPAIVVTLGTLNIYRGIDFAVAGSQEVSAFQVPASFLNIAGDNILGIPVFVIIAAVIAVIAEYFLRFSRQGRQLYAIGSNPEAAQIVGIRKSRRVFSAFLISGSLSGFAGVLWAAYFATIDSSAASGLELLVIASVVVGGVNIFGGSGSILGAMLGAIVLGTIQNALGILRVDQFWLQAFYGAAILIAVTLDALLTRQVQRLLVARRVR